MSSILYRITKEHTVKHSFKDKEEDNQSMA